jgi:hypothetical protein
MKRSYIKRRSKKSKVHKKNPSRRRQIMIDGTPNLMINGNRCLLDGDQQNVFKEIFAADGSSSKTFSTITVNYFNYDDNKYVIKTFNNCLVSKPVESSNYYNFKENEESFGFLASEISCYAL